MTTNEADAGRPNPTAGDGLASIALALGVLSFLAAFLAFWLIVVSVAFGVMAVALGVRARSRTQSPLARDLAVAAITLGVAGVLATGGSLMVNAGGESMGRHCVNEPSDPNC